MARRRKFRRGGFRPSRRYGGRRRGGGGSRRNPLMKVVNYGLSGVGFLAAQKYLPVGPAGSAVGLGLGVIGGALPPTIYAVARGAAIYAAYDLVTPYVLPMITSATPPAESAGGVIV